MAGDEQWRRELDEHDSAPFKELGRVVIAAAGSRPFLARPLLWRAAVGPESKAWHALAMTDRFVVQAELTDDNDTSQLRSTARVLRFSEIGEIVWTRSAEVGWDASRTHVTLVVGRDELRIPAGSYETELSEDQLALIDVIAAHLSD